MGDDVSTEDLRVLWDREAESWTRWARAPGLDVFFRDYNLPAFLEIVPPPAGVTVEVGCGEGRVSRALLESGHQVRGVDGSPSLARHALEGLDGVGSIPVATADAAALPLQSACADLVVSFMCMQDVDDLPASIDEIQRVLKPGGACCIAVLHPFDTAGQFAGDGPDAEFRLSAPYPVPTRYEEAVESHGIQMVFRGWHRPMATYLNVVIRAGLLIEEVREPTPTDAVARAHPRLTRQQRMPAWLHLRLRKPIEQGR